LIADAALRRLLGARGSCRHERRCQRRAGRQRRAPEERSARAIRLLVHGLPRIGIVATLAPRASGYWNLHMWPPLQETFADDVRTGRAIRSISALTGALSDDSPRRISTSRSCALARRRHSRSAARAA